MKRNTPIFVLTKRTQPNVAVCITLPKGQFAIHRAGIEEAVNNDTLTVILHRVFDLTR